MKFVVRCPASYFQNEGVSALGANNGLAQNMKGPLPGLMRGTAVCGAEHIPTWVKEKAVWP